MRTPVSVIAHGDAGTTVLTQLSASELPSLNETPRPKIQVSVESPPCGKSASTLDATDFRLVNVEGMIFNVDTVAPAAHKHKFDAAENKFDLPQTGKVFDLSLSNRKNILTTELGFKLKVQTIVHFQFGVIAGTPPIWKETR